MSLWDSVVDAAGKAGSAAKIAAQKTKLRTEMGLIEREKTARINTFGVQMYEYLNPLTESVNFWAADDTLTNLLRGPMIETQREIKALTNRRATLMEEYNQAQTKRTAAFATKADTWQGKLKNAGKSTVLAGNEGKLKTDIHCVEVQIKDQKHRFGKRLYGILVHEEDNNGYVAPEREVRKIFDTARSDIAEMEKRKQVKKDKLIALGGPTYDAPAPTSDDVGGNSNNNGGWNPAAAPTAAAPAPVAYNNGAPAPQATAVSYGTVSSTSAAPASFNQAPTATAIPISNSRGVSAVPVANYGAAAPVGNSNSHAAPPAPDAFNDAFASTPATPDAFNAVFQSTTPAPGAATATAASFPTNQQHDPFASSAASRPTNHDPFAATSNAARPPANGSGNVDLLWNYD